ncbi:hypothetical protein APHAL10511_005136 [Amanita phalloides]|nr:hypothetical protein APHAL10511_005136 [Amanita phalloides]
MTRYFDKAAKQCYRGALKPVFLRFGIEENNPAFDIRSGCIKIQGTQVTRFFEPTIECIIKAIEGQFRNGSMPIKAVFMIGAFATNYYLSSKLDRHFKPKRIIISGPYSYGHPNKAVVEGAILFKLRETCAVEMNRPGAHLNEPGLSAETLSKSSETNSTLVRPKRINRVGSGPSLNEAIGVFFQVDHALTACIAKYTTIWVSDSFSVILEKGTEVSEGKEFRKSCINQYTQAEFDDLRIERVGIKCYKGCKDSAPTCIDESSLFCDLCVVIADFSDHKKAIKPQIQDETEFYKIEFDVVLFFGPKELKAQIAWKQDGAEKRGPVSIVSDAEPTTGP